MTDHPTSAPIHSAQFNAAYTLMFIDDQADSDTVLLQLTMDRSGDVLERRVPRAAADIKLQSSALIDDTIDAVIVDLIAEYNDAAH